MALITGERSGARKTQRHEVVQPSGTAIEQHRTTYDWAYVYGGSQPHAPT